MIRAFIALELPAGLLRRLRDIGNELSSLGLNGRPTRPEAIHLTLRFLGNIESEQVPVLKDAVAPLSRQTHPFQLQLAGLGVFPNLTRPRIVWAGVRPNSSLDRMKQTLDEVLDGLGFDPEERPFRPHLTLFRLKSAQNRDGLIRYLSRRPEPPRFGSLQVNELHLFQSRRAAEGAQYTKLVSWNLEGESS